MAQRDFFRSPSPAWNARRIVGPKPPFKPKHVWAIRQQLKANGRVRDLALFDCGIDSKLRGCDLVKLRVSDVAAGGLLRLRATVIQQKTGDRSGSKSPTPRARLSPRGWLFEAVAWTTGCSRAAAAQAITSERASMPGSSTDGSR